MFDREFNLTSQGISNNKALGKTGQILDVGVAKLGRKLSLVAHDE